MLCPNCRMQMKALHRPGAKIREYLCNGCGFKKTNAKQDEEAPSEVKRPRLAPPADDVRPTFEADPEPPAEAPAPHRPAERSVPKPKSPPPKPEPAPKPEPPKAKKPEVPASHAAPAHARSDQTEITSPSKAKKKQAQAQKLSQLRQTLREISERVHDLEIQVDRRLSEIHSLLARLEKAVESYDDD